MTWYDLLLLVARSPFWFGLSPREDERLSDNSWTKDRSKISSFLPTKRATKLGEMYFSSLRCPWLANSRAKLSATPLKFTGLNLVTRLPQLFQLAINVGRHPMKFFRQQN